jgi:glutamyl-tRNA synthetase
MFNYLLRLGWSHGNDEIISREQAIEWFSLDHISKAPARFDLDKLLSLNHHYMRSMGINALQRHIQGTLMKERYGLSKLTQEQVNILIRALPLFVDRHKTLKDMADAMLFLIKKPTYTPNAQEILRTFGGFLLSWTGKPKDKPEFKDVEDWTAQNLEAKAKEMAAFHSVGKFADIAQPIRAAITGSTNSPPIFDLMEILGKETCMARLQATWY